VTGVICDGRSATATQADESGHAEQRDRIGGGHYREIDVARRLADQDVREVQTRAGRATLTPPMPGTRCIGSLSW